VDEASAGVRKTLEGMRREKERRMRRRIQADVDAGILPKGTDARALARFADALLEGMCMQARLGVSRADLEAALEVGLAGLRASMGAPPSG